MSTDRTIASMFRRRASFQKLPGICPACGTLSRFETCVRGNLPQGRVNGKPTGNGSRVYAEVAQCLACGEFAFGIGECRAFGAPIGHYAWPVQEWPDRAPEGLESEIKSSYDEARSVLSISPTAAAVLVRRCLQHVLRARMGITEPTLFEEIEKAAQRSELSKPTRDALQHVRQVGNWGAHPIRDQANTIIDVTVEEAEYTLETLEMVFYDLYVASARAATMEAKLRRRLEAMAEET